MKFYLSYFKLRFITSLQYKVSALAGISTQFFFGIVYVMVFLAFYDSNSAKGPMEIGELVSYLWLGQAFFSLLFMYYKDPEIFDLIKNGNIAYELIRPKNVYIMWFCKILSQRLASTTLRFLPVIVIGLLLPKPYGLSLPYSLDNFILFMVTLIIGTLLMTAIITFYHVISLNLLNEKGIINIFSTLADIFSGSTVPIPFFPLFLQKIAYVLPFRYINDLPFRIYSNNIDIANGINEMIIQIIWLILMILIGYFVMKKNLKKAVIQGG